MRASNLARPAPPAGAGCSLLPAGGLQAAAAWSTPSTCARRLLCCPRPPAAASGAARATRCSAFPHGEPQQLACGLQQRMGRAGSAWRPQRSSSIVRSTSTDSSSSSTGRFAGWVVPPLQHLVKQDDEAGRGSGQGQAGGPDAEYDEDYTWAGDAELDVVDGAEGRQPHAQAVDATSLLEGVMEAERAVAGIMQGVYLGEALAKRKGGSRSSGMAAGDSGQGAAASAAGGAPVAPPHFVGAVQVEDIPGKGWGLVATDLLEPGDIILVSEPLAVTVSQPGGPPPSPALLRSQLMRLQRALPADHPARVALGSMWCGRDRRLAVTREASRSRDARPPSLSQLPSAAAEPAAGAVKPPDISAWRSRRSPASRDGGDAEREQRLSQPAVTAAARPLTEIELDAVIIFNAFGDVAQDLAAARSRDEAPCAILGIWPEFALANHSCMPSAVHMVVGGCMVVRAAKKLLPGEEVTVNYLGRAVLAPAESRREELQGVYGFRCKCPRCKLEAEHAMALGRTLTTAAGNAEALRAALDQLLASKPQKSQGPGSQQQPTREGETPSEDPNAGSATGVVAPEGKQTDSSDGERAWLQQVQEVEAAAVSLQQALMQRLLELPGVKGDPLKLQQLLAACYDLYDVVAAAREALAPETSYALGARVDAVSLVGVILPGCDVETLGLARLAQKAQNVVGVDDPRTVALERACLSAHSVRYGPCRPVVMQRLIASGAEVAVELDALYKSAVTGSTSRSGQYASGLPTSPTAALVQPWWMDDADAAERERATAASARAVSAAAAGAPAAVAAGGSRSGASGLPTAAPAARVAVAGAGRGAIRSAPPPVPGVRSARPSRPTAPDAAQAATAAAAAAAAAAATAAASKTGGSGLDDSAMLANVLKLGVEDDDDDEEEKSGGEEAAVQAELGSGEERLPESSDSAMVGGQGQRESSSLGKSKPATPPVRSKTLGPSKKKTVKGGEDWTQMW